MPVFRTNVNKNLHIFTRKSLTTANDFFILYNVKTIGTTMAKCSKFQSQLLEAFKNANPKKHNRMYGEVFDDSLIVTIRKEKEGHINCVNSTTLTIRPFAKKPHTMEIDEIWYGYDGEGSRWSDHMGGCLVDCTGMNVQGAINAILAEMNKRV